MSTAPKLRFCRSIPASAGIVYANSRKIGCKTCHGRKSSDEPEPCRITLQKMIAPVNPDDLYRAQARRLRARLAHRPEALMEALASLAQWHNQQHASANESSSVVEEPLSPAAPSPRRIPSRRQGASQGTIPVQANRIADDFAVLDQLPGAQPAAARQFANIVTTSIQAGNILPYSNRQRLIRTAQRMGLGRFDANLIIALVQNRVGPTAADAQAATATAPSARKHWLVPLALILSIEALVGAYIFWLLVG